MTAAPPGKEKDDGKRASRPPWLTLVVVFAGLFGVLVAMGGELDAPTVALSLCGVALVFAIWRLFTVARALSVPAPHEFMGTATGGEKARLSDEFGRLLRAIKELEFDHELGKISDADFEGLEARYRQRAVEVMRALEDVESLHPSLKKMLEARDAERSGYVTIHDDEVTKPDGGLVTVGRVCGACQGKNDVDAKFCKHCGKELAA